MERKDIYKKVKKLVQELKECDCAIIKAFGKYDENIFSMNNAAAVFDPYNACIELDEDDIAEAIERHFEKNKIQNDWYSVYLFFDPEQGTFEVMEVE